MTRGQLMDTVFVKEGVIQKLHQSHHFICSHPIWGGGGGEKVSQEPIGQKLQLLGINNVESETSHRREREREKLQLDFGAQPFYNRSSV